MALLEVAGLVAGYGETEILHGVSMRVEAGEIVTVIGPNGCGKSTLMKAIVGLVGVRSGRVEFRGEEITNGAPERIVRSGLCYVPQSENLFPSLTIRENLEMGAYTRTGDFQGRIDEMFALFPDLGERPSLAAGSLSGGQRQMLALARALMLDPELLLLDEPSAGLSPAMVGSTFERLRGVNGAGVSLLLVEQNARQALAMSDRGYVLAAGENQLDGPGKALLDDEEVARLYLGGGRRSPE